MKAFFDTNVLVCAFDAGEPGKRKRAARLLSESAAAGAVVVSAQVLQEFYVTVTRKLELPLPPDAALRAVTELANFPVVPSESTLVLAAIGTHRKHAISFWDALIVEAARIGGATVLYSEDLQSGQSFGSVTISNPFV